MNEIIVTAIVSSFCSGGLAWLFTLKYTRKQAEADAMLSVQNVYQQIIQDLKTDREELKENVRSLKERDEDRERKITDLEQKVNNNEREIALMRPNLCGRKGCDQRISIN